jgi:Flp pilus assembly protein TadG
MEHKTAQRHKKEVGRLPLQAARQPKTAESGQTMLEFALMLPFMMLLLLGIAEIGRAAFITIKVSNAATAGAEYGSQNGTTASDFAGMQHAAFCDANGQITINCNAGILTQTPVATNGCTCDTGGVSCYPMPADKSCTPTFSCPNGQQIVECVRVTTHADFSPLFHYPGLPKKYQANGNAIQRVRH